MQHNHSNQSRRMVIFVGMLTVVAVGASFMNTYTQINGGI